MLDLLINHEATIRLGFFLAVFLIMAAGETLFPKRRREISRIFRWSNNLSLVVINSLVVRFVFPVLAVGVAIFAQQKNFGLFNWLDLPLWFTFVASLLLMDLAIYLQHVLFHRVPVLWRLHRVHHTDVEVDISTGIRFHPFEILLSMGIKIVVVFLLGAPAAAVVIFETLLNATALFNHSNLRLPLRLDRVLRWILVTPDMHRIHHSIVTEETNSNYGFNMTCWDRLFATYREQPKAGHNAMRIGIELFRTPKDTRLDQMLVQPFRN